jgi:hypothetical protein
MRSFVRYFVMTGLKKREKPAHRAIMTLYLILSKLWLLGEDDKWHKSRLKNRLNWLPHPLLTGR